MGLYGICITDHDSMEARKYIREGIQEDGLCVIIGQEYSTPQGHFLLFGPLEDLPHYLSAGEMLRRVRDMGGVAIASHPFRKLQSVDEKLVSSGLVQYAEGINARNSNKENSLAQNWQEKYQVTLTGGSDAHALDELGLAATRFLEPVTSREELVQALQEKKFEPCYNPYYKNSRAGR